MMKTIFNLFVITCYNIICCTNGYIITNPVKTTFLTNTNNNIIPNNNQNNQQLLTMKISSGKQKAKTSQYKGSTIAMNNYNRVKAAGKKGSKRFVDPCKLFIGNLSFNSTESDLETFFVTQNSIPREHIMSIKIIREWKTQESKGYGFILFRDPIFATSALECVKGQKLNGRVIRLSQGQKKLPDTVYLVKKKKKQEEEEDFDFSFIENEEEIDDDDDDEFDGYESDYDDEYLLNEELETAAPTTREERTATTRKERRELKVKWRKMLKKRAVGFGNTSGSSSSIKEM